ALGTAQEPTTAASSTPTPDTADSSALRHANGLYLAYVTTPSPAHNENYRRALYALSLGLIERTSIEPRGVAAVNIETDDLTFFPVLFWPIVTNTNPLSEKEQERIQKYIDHGGTIVFDV